jgi:16S rRNA (guanine966-N2)-methyltransferase
MRITGGVLKNRKLVPPPPGISLRPTTDKVRSAFFSSVGDVTGLSFLDLFAGTGAVGIEAASRGAAHIVFFDKDASYIKKNIRLIPNEIKFEIIKDDVANSRKRLAGKVFDIVYIDPPYASLSASGIILPLKENLSENALIAYEESIRAPFAVPDGFEMIKEREYGDTVVRYMKAVTL